MPVEDLDAKIARANTSLHRLLDAQESPAGARPLAALAEALEELEVASEELREQNDELVALRDVVDSERRKYERLFAHAPDAYLLTDLHGLIAEANLQAAHLLATSRDRLRGTPLANHVPFSERARFRQQLAALADGGEKRGWKLWLQPTDASRRAVSIDVTPDEESTPHDARRLRWVIHDVEELTERAAELQTAFNLERERVASLQDLNRWKTGLLRAAAHDLGQPLQAIGGAAALLRRSDEITTERSAQLIDIVDRNAVRLDRLIGDLMDLDRLTHSGSRLKRDELFLPDVVRGVVDEVDAAGREVVLDVEAVTVPLGRVELERIVENLVRNALTHTDPGTPIWIRAGMSGHTVHLTVEDAGPGVAAEERQRIFEPFQRAETSAPGSGLGLSLVRLFAELHGGAATLADRPGGGASFRVALPVHGPFTAGHPSPSAD